MCRPRTRKMRRRLRLWRRQKRKRRQSKHDDIIVFIALGGAFVAGLVAFALWVMLPTMLELCSL